MTEGRVREPIERNEIAVGEIWAYLRPNFWKMVLVSLLISVVTFLFLLLKPNIYQAVAIISPPEGQAPTNSGQGALASIGVVIGGPSHAEDLETLFKSTDLAVRVFEKHDLWSIVYGTRFDSATRKLRPRWYERLGGVFDGPRQPRDWDAIRAARKCMKVVLNRKSNTISISFESPSPAGSAAMVGYFLEEGKSRLQEEALDRAVKNKLFIQQQIERTHDALTRDRLFALYGQEVEKEMMARNREQFGFRVIDAPRVPDRRLRPRRGLIAIAAAFVSLLGMFVLTIVLKRDGG